MEESLGLGGEYHGFDLRAALVECALDHVNWRELAEMGIAHLQDERADEQIDRREEN